MKKVADSIGELTSQWKDHTVTVKLTVKDRKVDIEVEPPQPLLDASNGNSSNTNSSDSTKGEDDFDMFNLDDPDVCFFN